MLELQNEIDFYYLKYVRYEIDGRVYPLLTDPKFPLFNTTKGWEIYYDGWYFYIVPQETIKLVNSCGNDEVLFWEGNEINFPFNPHWADKYFTRNKLYIKNGNDEDEIITTTNVIYGHTDKIINFRLDISNKKIDSKQNTLITLF